MVVIVFSFWLQFLDRTSTRRLLFFWQAPKGSNQGLLFVILLWVILKSALPRKIICKGKYSVAPICKTLRIEFLWSSLDV